MTRNPDSLMPVRPGDVASKRTATSPIATKKGRTVVEERPDSSAAVRAAAHQAVPGTGRTATALCIQGTSQRVSRHTSDNAEGGEHGGVGGVAIDPEVLARLTPRETEVLALMAEGLSNGQQIARGGWRCPTAR